MTALHLQVPFRRVHLTNDTHFDLYDTSGPQVIVIFMLYGVTWGR
jgi:hypothetical protein